MTNPPSTSPFTDIQFDRAVAASGAAATGVACSNCGSAIPDMYYTLARKPFCGACKESVERHVAATRTRGAFLKAATYGIGAAIAGAVIYYAVIALANLEIGIVAILIGFMVGYMVKKAVPLGGRRYQILAAVLTYLSVGMAYVPLAFHADKESDKKTADSVTVATHAPAPTTAEAPKRDEPLTTMSFLSGIGALLALPFILPVLVVFSSMPGGLLSAAIIAFGIRHAWRMTAAPELTFAGPLHVAPAPAS